MSDENLRRSARFTKASKGYKATYDEVPTRIATRSKTKAKKHTLTQGTRSKSDRIPAKGNSLCPNIFSDIEFPGLSNLANNNTSPYPELCNVFAEVGNNKKWH